MAGYNRRVDEMTAAAQEIIDADREARDAKTARLRQARMQAKATGSKRAAAPETQSER